MKIKELVDSKTDLFSSPDIACKLSKLLQISPNHNDVIEVVQYDPALTLKILRICNSPVFGSAERVASLDAAISRIGYHNLLRIVWTIGIGSKISADLPVYRMSAGELWRHSVTTAVAAEAIWKESGVLDGDASTAFTAGLVHDIGKVVINDMLLDDPALLEGIHSEGVFPMAAEESILGVNHAQLGGELLTKWGLPNELILAVANHHCTEIKDISPLCSLLHIADMCSHALGSSSGWSALSYPLVEDCLILLRLEERQIERVMLAIWDRWDEIEEFLQL